MVDRKSYPKIFRQNEKTCCWRMGLNSCGPESLIQNHTGDGLELIVTGVPCIQNRSFDHQQNACKKLQITMREWDLLLSASQKNNVEQVQRLINHEGVPPSHGNVVGQTAVRIMKISVIVSTVIYYDGTKVTLLRFRRLNQNQHTIIGGYELPSAQQLHIAALWGNGNVLYPS